MDAYDILRQQARKRRDAAFDVSRHEYYAALKEIDRLQRALEGEAKAFKVQTSAKLVRQAIPHDRLFTMPELIKAVKLAQPDRVIHDQTVRAYINTLKKAKEIRAVKRRGAYVFYAAWDYETPPDKFGAKPITLVAIDILKDTGPLRMSELNAKIRETGYRNDVTPKKLLSILDQCLRRNKKTFFQDGQRWGLCGA
jgi:hypothetical protein